MNLVFCIVSLLGAFLLFQVQPVISKFILPWFGGSPGVWTTCMLFFQMVLFGGYSYAHFLAQWRPRRQAIVHGCVLLLAALCLPIAPSESLKPSGSEAPVLKILLLLLRTVGLPYFVLSATSPLVQVWFSHQFPKRSPWRLYSLSNIGSLTALLTYPVLIETRWDVLAQTQIWSWIFVVFALLMGVLGYVNQRRDNAITPEGDLHPQAETHDVKPTWLQRLSWLLLPGFASLMLLATTNHVCQDVAVIPFLWVIPLSLYLISFIICFDHPRWYARAGWALPAVVLLFLASGMFEIDWPYDWSPGFIMELAILLGAMFLICMVCHGELARLKPGTKYLTEYYLLMSAGGALGGLVISILAPMVFTSFFEWSLALLAGFALVSWVAYDGLFAKLSGTKKLASGAVWLVVLGVAFYKMAVWEFTFGERLDRKRDFYGVLSVEEVHPKGETSAFRWFWHGGTKHGCQNMAEDKKRDPLTYYGHDTGVGISLDSLKAKPDTRVGVVGMGAGTVACYAEPGQTYRFYEINPSAVDMALKWFTFISDMQKRGAKYELVSGDARLQMEHEAPQNYDVLLLDAFSGDSVPVHLLTREAFELYLRHLKPNGVIAVHITNRYLNLAPVVERVAQEFKLATTRIYRGDDNVYGRYHTDYVVLSRDQAFIAAHPPQLPEDAKKIDVPLWTDHLHNLFQILQRR
jgi:hypothetical protein